MAMGGAFGGGSSDSTAFIVEFAARMEPLIDGFNQGVAGLQTFVAQMAAAFGTLQGQIANHTAGVTSSVTAMGTSVGAAMGAVTTDKPVKELEKFKAAMLELNNLNKVKIDVNKLVDTHKLSEGFEAAFSVSIDKGVREGVIRASETSIFEPIKLKMIAALEAGARKAKGPLRESFVELAAAMEHIEFKFGDPKAIKLAASLVAEVQKEAAAAEKIRKENEETRLKLIKQSADITRQETTLAQQGANITAGHLHTETELARLREAGLRRVSIALQERLALMTQEKQRQQELIGLATQRKNLESAFETMYRSQVRMGVQGIEQVRAAMQQQIRAATDPADFRVINEALATERIKVKDLEFAFLQVREAVKSKNKEHDEEGRLVNKEQLLVANLIKAFQQLHGVTLSRTAAERVLATESQSSARQFAAIFRGVYEANQRSVSMINTFITQINRASAQIRTMGLITAATFGGFLASTVSMAEHMRLLSEEAGITVVQAQKLNTVFGEYGLTTQQAERSLKIFAKSLDDAKEGAGNVRDKFIKLGISQLDLAAAGDSLIDKLMLVSDHIKDIKDPAERAARATDLFGKGAVALIPILNAGKEAIKAAFEKAPALTDAQAASIIKLSVEVENVKNRFLILGADLINSTKPAIDTVIGLFERFAAGVQALPPWIKGFIVTLAEVSATVAVVGGILVPFIAALGSLAMLIADVATAASVAASGVGLAALAGVFGSIAAGAGAAAVAVGLLTAAFLTYTLNLGSQSQAMAEEARKWDAIADAARGAAHAKRDANNAGSDTERSIAQRKAHDELTKAMEGQLKKVQQLEEAANKANTGQSDDEGHIYKKGAFDKALTQAKIELDNYRRKLLEVNADIARDIHANSVEMTNKQVVEQTKAEIEQMRMRIKEGSNLRDSDVDDLRRHLLEMRQLTDLTGDERIKAEAHINAQVAAIRMEMYHANAAAIKQELAASQAAIGKRIVMAQLSGEEEIDAYRESAKAVIASRNITAGEKYLLEEELEKKIATMRASYRNRELAAERDTEKQLLILGLETGTKKMQDIDAYYAHSMALIESSIKDAKVKADAEARLAREVWEMKQKFLRHELQGNLDTIRQIMEARRHALEEDKIATARALEEKKALRFKELEILETEVAQKVMAGQVSEGEGERMLWELKRKKHEATIQYDKDEEESRQGMAQRRVARDKTDLDDLKARLATMKSEQGNLSQAMMSTAIARRHKAASDIQAIQVMINKIDEDSKKSDGADAKAKTEYDIKVANEKKVMANEEFEHRVKVLKAFRTELENMTKFEKNLATDAVSRAIITSDSQIDAFRKIGAAAMAKAQEIEDAAQREKAVQEVTTRLLKDETEVRRNLLKTMREAYETEFGQIFDFLKEVGGLHKDVLKDMQKAIEDNIVTLVQQKGASALADSEAQRLFATYKKVSNELEVMNKAGGGFGGGFTIGGMTDSNGKAVAGGGGGFMGGFGESPVSASMKQLSDRLSMSFDPLNESMKKLGKEFTGQNGLAYNSEHLSNRFRTLADVVGELTARLRTAVGGIGKPDNFMAPVPGTTGTQRTTSQAAGTTMVTYNQDTTLVVDGKRMNGGPALGTALNAIGVDSILNPQPSGLGRTFPDLGLSWALSLKP